MLTIKVFLDSSGTVARLDKDFPLYSGAFQDKLLNVYAPTAFLSPNYVYADDGASVEFYTTVKIGCVATARNGKIVKSRNYYMRYLKTLVKDGIEYALYERKLPKEFTALSGQGANAPTMVINVVNIDNTQTPAKKTQVIPSQSCKFDVLPSADLDQDEPIEASEYEEITGQINEILETLPTKQDKVDSQLSVPESVEPEERTVVGAINENATQIELLHTKDDEQDSDIGELQDEIAEIKATYSKGLDYIGTMSVTALPTQESLSAFVEAQKGRVAKNGDFILVALTVSGGTDRVYQYIYNGTQWQQIEIPPVEIARNGEKGVLQGTYGIGKTYETLVDIVDGEIRNVYVFDSTLNVYRNIAEFTATNRNEIDKIKDGRTAVAKALESVADDIGNNIVDTYLTKLQGATKEFVKEYALPKEFNEVYFLSDNNEYVKNIVENVHYTAECGIGDTELYTADMTLENIQFELSSRNSCANKIYVSSNISEAVQFRLSTYAIKENEEPTLLGVDLTDVVQLEMLELKTLNFQTVFTQLGDEVLKMGIGDKIRQTLEIVRTFSTAMTLTVHSDIATPTTFNLFAGSLIFVVASGEIGEQRKYVATEWEKQGNILVAILPSDTEIHDRTEAFVVLPKLPLDVVYDLSTRIYLQRADSGEFIPLSCVDGSVTVEMLDRVKVAETENYIFKAFFEVAQLTESVSAYCDIARGGGGESSIPRLDELPEATATSPDLVIVGGQLYYKENWETITYTLLDSNGDTLLDSNGDELAVNG